MRTPPRPAGIYEAEDTAARKAGLRRFRTFSELEEVLQRVVQGDWWAAQFPNAPLEVEVSRRSRNATFSAAATDSQGVGLIAIVDGSGWGMETILHELAHLAAGPDAGHGSRFAEALLALWRHEAGIEAWACLRTELDAAGTGADVPSADGPRPDGVSSARNAADRR